VEPKLFDAIRLIQSLEPQQLSQLALGYRALVFQDGKFQIVDESDHLDHALFEGGQEWLETRVPEQERHGEQLRRYILDYVDEIFDYVVACWREPATS